MENTNETASTEATKEVIKINLESPVDFNAVADVNITTTNELGKIINDVFVQCFKDYFGCTIEVQYQPDKCAFVIVPKLFFHVLKENEYKTNDLFAFKPLGSESGSSIVDRVKRIGTISSMPGVKVDITDAGKSVLEDFIIVPSGMNTEAFLKDFDWTKAYEARATETETFIQVFKLDINKFVKKIFGAKDADGVTQFYQITPTGIINSNNQYKKADNWSINILRLNAKNEAKAAELLGYGAPINVAGPNINTATTRG